MSLEFPEIEQENFEEKISGVESLTDLYAAILAHGVVESDTHGSISGAEIIENMQRAINRYPLDQEVTFAEIVRAAPRAEGIRDKWKELVATDTISRTTSPSGFIEVLQFLGSLPSSSGEEIKITDEFLEPLLDLVEKYSDPTVDVNVYQSVVNEVKMRVPRAYGVRDKFVELFTRQ